MRNFASTATDGSYGERAHEDELGDVARRLYITIFLMRARRRTSADVSSLSEGKKGKGMGAPSPADVTREAFTPATTVKGSREAMGS